MLYLTSCSCWTYVCNERSPVPEEHRQPQMNKRDAPIRWKGHQFDKLGTWWNMIHNGMLRSDIASLRGTWVQWVAVGSLPLWIQHHIVCTTQHPLWLPCTRDTPLIPVSLWLLHDDGNPPPPDSRVSASTPAGPGYKRKKTKKKTKTLYLAAIRSNVSFFSLENMTSLCYLWLRRYRFSLRCLSSAAPCGDLDEDKQNTYGFYTMVHHVVNRARKHVLTWIHRDGSGPCWLS